MALIKTNMSKDMNIEFNYGGRGITSEKEPSLMPASYIITYKPEGFDSEKKVEIAAGTRIPNTIPALGISDWAKANTVLEIGATIDELVTHYMSAKSERKSIMDGRDNFLESSQLHDHYAIKHTIAWTAPSSIIGGIIGYVTGGFETAIAGAIGFATYGLILGLTMASGKTDYLYKLARKMGSFDITNLEYEIGKRPGELSGWELGHLRKAASVYTQALDKAKSKIGFYENALDKMISRMDMIMPEGYKVLVSPIPLDSSIIT